MKKGKMFFGVLASLIILQGCGETESTSQLGKNIDVLIVLKHELGDQCSDGAEKSCKQMTALVDTLDSLIVKGESTSDSGKEIIKKWVDSHRVTHDKNGKIIVRY